MFLIIGLGNPGANFQKTRHNIGFRVLDFFQKKNSFPDFRMEKKFNSFISKKRLSNKEIILAKPQTFMNNSGTAVKKLINNLKLKTNNLWVVHDDLDICLGRIRIVQNRGSAGHKGVWSIIKELRSKNFTRFRIGVKPSQVVIKRPEEFVVRKFSRGQEKIIKEIIPKAAEAIETALKRGADRAMNEFNSLS